MSTDRWERVEAVFSEAASMAPQERALFLAQACAGDAPLRAEVEELLTAHDVSIGPLDRPLFERRETTPSLFNGQIMSGRFRIRRFVGRGGMGEVYEAEDLDLGVTVALKTLLREHLADPRLQARFRREIHLARRVTHANVCRVFDLGKDVSEGRETNFLTMQFLEGVTLADHLRERGTLTPEEALPLIRQMAEGLSALAEAGIVHRDFKPGNIMLTPAEGQLRVMIMDFGLARPIAAENRHTILSTAGLVMGTPAYMAPEQLLGERVGPFSDVYALAVVTYELITGSAPFKGNTVIRVMLRKLTEAPPAPTTVVPGLDAWWDEFVLRCMERDVERRVQSPQEVLQLLDELAVGRSGAVRIAAAAEAGPVSPQEPGVSVSHTAPIRDGVSGVRKRRFGWKLFRAAAAEGGAHPTHAGGEQRAGELRARTIRTELHRSTPTAAPEVGSRLPDRPTSMVAQLGVWVASAVMLVGLGAAVAWQFPAIQAPLTEQVCSAWPGSSFFCVLPADKDLAVLPFQIEGATEGDRELARGVAQHLADLSARLYPRHADYCLHFRKSPGEIYSEKLSATWSVRVDGEQGDIRAEVRRVEDDKLVRIVRRAIPLDDLAALNDAFRASISALGESIADRDLRTWEAPEASKPGAAVSYLRGRGYLAGPGYLSEAPPKQAWERARSHLLDATSKGGYDFAAAMVALGDAYQEECLTAGTASHCESANNVYSQAQATPEYAPLYASWGKLQLASGQGSQGIASLRRALRMDPFDLATRQALADALEADNRGSEAEQVWIEGIEQEGQCWLYNNALSLVYLNSGKYEDSERQMVRSIALSPGHVGAYGNLALIYMMQGRYSDAIAAASRTVEANGHPQARTTLGRAYYFQGCTDQGLAQLELAVEQGGRNKYIYQVNLAEILLFEQPLDEYIRSLLRDALSRATAVERDDPRNALRAMARAYAWLGEQDAAIDALNQLDRADPRSRLTAGTAAAVYEILGRRSEAIEWLEQGFERGLSVHELHHSPAFRKLRQSAELRDLLRDHGLDLSADPGDTIRDASQPCAQLATDRADARRSAFR